jgi:hypothetical protein
MESCPICKEPKNSEDQCASCAYNFIRREIVDNKFKPEENIKILRTYHNFLKQSKNWIEEITFKHRINDIQGKKYGMCSIGSRADYKWSEEKTGKLLNENKNRISPDLRLAEALDYFPELLNYRTKSDARAKLKEIKSGGPFSKILKIFDSERLLQDYLQKNWNSIKEFDGLILKGSNYNAGDAGFIDLLAYNPAKGEWIVLELKKGFNPDKTVAQTQRYMGWIRKKLKTNNETVSGIIISGYPPDNRIEYALSNNPEIEHKIYAYDRDKESIYFIDTEAAYALSKMTPDEQSVPPA